MTRDEFIDRYLERSEIPEANRTSNGWILGTRRYLALPCACGDESCEGWAMINEDMLSHYLFFDAQEPLRSAWYEACGGAP